jgi:large subunit ribosomal protein L9
MIQEALMQLILRADVENLGRLGEVVSVKPGYGRNFLLPQGLAMAATAGNLKVFEQERRKLQARMDALRAEAIGVAERINGLECVVPMRVGDNGKLYGSVTTAIIAEHLSARGIEIDRRRILTDQPIRSVGDHQVRVRLHADVVAAFTIHVVSEDKAQYAEPDERPAAPVEQPVPEPEDA